MVSFGVRVTENMRTATLNNLADLAYETLQNGGSLDEAISACLRENLDQFQPLDESEIHHIARKVNEVLRSEQSQDNIVNGFNRTHCVVLWGGTALVIRENGADIETMTIQNFRNFYSHLPKVDGVAAATYWLNHPDRRSYDRVVYAPDGNCEATEYNLWRGFKYQAIPGDCDLYLTHIRENIARGDETLYYYILDWMADAVQNPATQPGIALVLCGKQGTGKGCFVSVFGELFGKHFKPFSNSEHVFGRFTSQLHTAQVVFLDEIVWGGDITAEARLKAMVSESTLTVEGKGREPMEIPNYARFIMATNSDWAVPAGAEERRFCVLNVGEAQMQNHAYFDAIFEQMRAGGYEALMHVLKTRDIQGVNIRQFPRTTALLEQKLHTLPSVERWWYDCLNTGDIGNIGWPSQVVTADLYAAYKEATLGRRFDRNAAGSCSQFVRALKRVIDLGVQKKIPRSSGPRVPSARVNGYELPTLELCRAQFENHLKQPIEWEIDV